MPPRFSRFASSPRTLADDIPASPPREVLDAIAAADAAYGRLEATGRRVRFDLDLASGRLAMELTDDRGARLQRLSPRAVLDLATTPPATLD